MVAPRIFLKESKMGWKALARISSSVFRSFSRAILKVMLLLCFLFIGVVICPQIAQIFADPCLFILFICDNQRNLRVIIILFFNYFLRLDMDQHMLQIGDFFNQMIFQSMSDFMSISDGNIAIDDGMQIHMVFHPCLSDIAFLRI